MWAQSTGALEMLGFCPQLQLPGLHPSPSHYRVSPRPGPLRPGPAPPPSPLCLPTQKSQPSCPLPFSLLPYSPPPTPATASSCTDQPGWPHCGAHRGEAGRSPLRAEGAGPDSRSRVASEGRWGAGKTEGGADERGGERPRAAGGELQECTGGRGVEEPGTGRLRGGARGATQGQGAGCAQAVRPAESVSGLWGLGQGCGAGARHSPGDCAACSPRPSGRRAPAALAPDSELRSGARGAGGEAGRGERWREVGVPGRGWGGVGAGTRLPAGPAPAGPLTPFLPEVSAARPQP